MNIKDIVAEWLGKNGYDGLFVPGECACKNDELFPCGETYANCEPGYLKTATNCPEHDWHIGPKDSEDTCSEACR